MEPNRAEAERLLGVSSNLLLSKDFPSSKQFALLAQETDPLLEGSDQILTIIDVLTSSKPLINSHVDYYSILQLPHKTHDLEAIKKQYRRLALLLHPDKNKFAFAESAFHLVAEAWGVLSDPGRKNVFDAELGDFGRNFLRVDLQESRKRKENDAQNLRNHEFGGVGGRENNQEFGAGRENMRNHELGREKNQEFGGGRGKNQELGGREKMGNREFGGREKFPVSGSGSGSGFSMKARKRGRPKGTSGRGKGRSNGVGGSRGGGLRKESFWTGCPYCYNLYEYPKMYEGCCMRCVNCKKGFTAEGRGNEPPKVPGKEQYYCCWGTFPMGFGDGDGVGRGRGFEDWIPAMQNAGEGNVGVGRGRGRGRGWPRGRGKGNVNFTPKAKEVEVPVGVPLASANVNGEVLMSPVPVSMVSGNVDGSVSPVTVATAGGYAAGSVTPGSGSAPPMKRGRGRPRKNPLP